MQESVIIDTIERYIRGEMQPEEKVFFEELRKTNPSVDQMVVEHTAFLGQLGQYGEIRDLKARLNEVHQSLSASGEIKEERQAMVVVLWKKYKRVIGVAASIAGVTALGISGLISYFAPHVNPDKVALLDRRLSLQESQMNNVKSKLSQGSATADMHFTSNGTGFLIDARGYMVTNAHVVGNATRIEVQNAQGEFKARIVYIDLISDLAVLKIDDSTYKTAGALPYGISRTGMELGDEIFTLGYPRNEIVYGKGYMSAKTGFEGDTLACQITIAANPGNSGSPVINRDGEIVGIVRASQQDAQGFVFAIRSKNIFRLIDSVRTDSTLLKSDSLLARLKIPQVSSIKGMDRTQQIRKIEDCIFIVRR